MRTIQTQKGKFSFTRLRFNKSIEYSVFNKTFFLGLLLIQFFLFTNLTANPGLIDDTKRNWVLDKSIDNVDFYYCIATCNGESVVFLKFNNKNNFDVIISWEEIFVTKQVKEKRNGFNGVKKMIVPKGITSQEDCDNIIHKECIIHPAQVNPAYKPEVEIFEYKVVQVVPN